MRSPPDRHCQHSERARRRLLPAIEQTSRPLVRRGGRGYHTAMAMSAHAPGHAAPSDERLLAQCRAGDGAAFGTIVQRYEAPLLRHCGRIAGATGAQDAVQDAFLEAWRAIHDGAEVRALRPWLFTIAHRRAVAAVEAGRRCAAELPDSLSSSRSPADEAGRSAQLRATLA